LQKLLKGIQTDLIESKEVIVELGDPLFVGKWSNGYGYKLD